MFNKKATDKEKSLVCLSRLPYFESGSPLIEADNIEYVDQYYLFENLSAGLVHEDWLYPSLWQPWLSESWEMAENALCFSLRPDLKWSDGSNIEISDWLEHFKTFKDKDYRHISILRKTEVFWDHKLKRLCFQLAKVFHKSLITELSLSDSLLLHKKNLDDDWSVTSGPYYVAKSSHTEIELKANPYFHRTIGPKVVTIRPRSKENINRGFDLLKRPPYGFLEQNKQISKLSDRTWTGKPTKIYYFRFGKNNKLAKSEQLRIVFAKIVHKAFLNYVHEKLFERQLQMIPKGYAGRLNESPELQVGDFDLKGEELVVALSPEVLDSWGKRLYEVAKKEGVTLHLVGRESKIESDFAILENIIGNQRSPLGTWNFLFAKVGPLGAYHDFSKEYLNSNSANAVLELHRKVLQKAIAVPFLAEYDALLASEKLNLERINPFDQRLRFYRMSWY